MAIVFTSGWESSGGSDVTDGGTWSSHSGTGTLSVYNVGAAEGTYLLLASGHGNDFLTENHASSISNCAYRFYFFQSSIAVDVEGMVTMYNGGPGAFYRMHWNNATSSIQFAYVNSIGSTVQIGSDWAATANTWYQIEMLHTNATVVEWKAWSQDGSTLITSGTSSSNIQALNVERTDCGFSNNPGGTQIFGFDYINVSDAGYLGPITSGGTKRWLLVR